MERGTKIATSVSYSIHVNHLGFVFKQAMDTNAGTKTRVPCVANDILHFDMGDGDGEIDKGPSG